MPSPREWRSSQGTRCAAAGNRARELAWSSPKLIAKGIPAITSYPTGPESCLCGAWRLSYWQPARFPIAKSRRNFCHLTQLEGEHHVHTQNPAAWDGHRGRSLAAFIRSCRGRPGSGDGYAQKGRFHHLLRRFAHGAGRRRSPKGTCDQGLRADRPRDAGKDARRSADRSRLGRHRRTHGSRSSEASREGRDRQRSRRSS